MAVTSGPDPRNAPLRCGDALATTVCSLPLVIDNTVVGNSVPFPCHRRTPGCIAGSPGLVPAAHPRAPSAAASYVLSVTTG